MPPRLLTSSVAATVRLAAATTTAKTRSTDLMGAPYRTDARGQGSAKVELLVADRCGRQAQPAFGQVDHDGDTQAPARIGHRGHAGDADGSDEQYDVGASLGSEDHLVASPVCGIISATIHAPGVRCLTALMAWTPALLMSGSPTSINGTPALAAAWATVIAWLTSRTSSAT